MKKPPPQGDEALILGKALAGLNAQAKGRRLGLFKPHEEKAKKAREKERGQRFLIEVCGPVSATNTDDGIWAIRGSKPIDPDSVRRYLGDKLGEEVMDKSTRSGNDLKDQIKRDDSNEVNRWGDHRVGRIHLPRCFCAGGGTWEGTA